MTKTQHHAAVIGDPIGQSLSPLIHNHWFEKYAVAGRYDALQVPSEGLKTWVDDQRHGGQLVGWNVTIPHKTAITAYLDKLAPLARQMGAVNTVQRGPNGHLTGFNTDGLGLMTYLKKSYADWPRDKPALILGAGGAARAAALMLVNEAIPAVMACNRTTDKATELAQAIGRGRIVVSDWSDRSRSAAAAGLIVNTTSLGMIGQPPLDIDFSGVPRDSIFYDIVYKPLETTAICSARDKGLRTLDGLGMLVYQAAAAFKIWFGIEPDYDDALRAKLLAALI